MIRQRKEPKIARAKIVVSIRRGSPSTARSAAAWANLWRRLLAVANAPEIERSSDQMLGDDALVAGNGELNDRD